MAGGYREDPEERRDEPTLAACFFAAIVALLAIVPFLFVQAGLARATGLEFIDSTLVTLLFGLLVSGAVERLLTKRSN